MSKTESTKWRALALALIGAVVVGLVITPAAAHFRPKIGHLFKHFKAKADPIYVNVGETVENATNAQNADRLDGLDSTQLSPGGGAGRTADLTLTGMTDQTVLSTTVTTASASTVLASATVDVADQDGGGDGIVTCSLRFDGTTSSAEFDETVQTAPTIPHDSLSLVWAHDVGAGTHSVELRCRNVIDDVIVDDAGLIVSAHL